MILLIGALYKSFKISEVFNKLRNLKGLIFVEKQVLTTFTLIVFVF